MKLPRWATTVTPLSKTIALLMIIILPFAGFVLGMKYQQLKVVPGDDSSFGSTNSYGLANPAAVYCTKQGGKSEIITAKDGSQSGQCVFSDGRKCDDWQFFRTKICKKQK